METAPAQTVAAPIIKGAGIHIECRVVETKNMQPASFDKELTDRWYGDNDWHTYYVGVITAAYKE